MADDDEELTDYQVCVGRLCFLRPYPLYVPPPFYRRTPGWDYRWKVGAKLSTAPGLRLKLQRALAVPNCLGLGNDARWRWQWIPLSILMGIKIDPFQQSQCVLDDPSCSTEYINGSAWPPPYVRIKSLTPILGKLGAGSSAFAT